MCCSPVVGEYRPFRKDRQKRGWMVGSFMEASQMHGVSLWKRQWLGLELEENLVRLMSWWELATGHLICVRQRTKSLFSNLRKSPNHKSSFI